jgi:hypothetical protein
MRESGDNNDFVAYIIFVDYSKDYAKANVKCMRDCLQKNLNDGAADSVFACVSLQGANADGDFGQNIVPAPGLDQKIKSQVEKAKADKKRGIIFISGNVGSVGISLPDVDAVIHLNAAAKGKDTSADLFLQRAFRQV